MVNSGGTVNKIRFGDRLRRFLAIAMMFSVGWTVWIICELNPPPLKLKFSDRIALPDPTTKK